MQLTGSICSETFNLSNLRVEHIYEYINTITALHFLNVVILCDCGYCSYLKSMQIVPRDKTLVINQLQRSLCLYGPRIQNRRKGEAIANARSTEVSRLKLMKDV